MLGAVLTVCMFVLGVGAGWLIHPQSPGGTRVMITATDAVPTDLEGLSLSPEQRDSVRAAIRRGRDRVLRVVDDFDPRMRAALDTTNVEIRAVLDSTQRVRFDSLRRASGPTLQRRLIRTDSAGRTREEHR
jgi:uncharacterized membrane protein